MAEYKGKLLKGLFTRADKCLMNDGVTSVEYLLSVETETVGGVVFSKEGNVITIYGYGISPSSMPVIPEKYRPKSVVLSPAVYLNSGNLFNAYIGISTAGAMNPSYSATYGGQAVTPSGGAMYFSISYNNA